MPVPSPLLGVPVPTSADNPQNDGALQLAMVSALELYSVPRFASLSALKTAIPTGGGSNPSLAYVTNDRHYVWVPAPYNLWGPLPGTESEFGFGGRTDATPTVGPSPQPQNFGITQVFTVPQYDWPTRCEVKFRALVNGGNDTDQVNVFIKINGSSTDGYFRVIGSGTAVCNVTIENEGAASGAGATTVQGGIERVSGTANTTVSASDARFTFLELLVKPNYQGVGGA